MCNQFRPTQPERLAAYFGVQPPLEAYKAGIGPKGFAPYVRPSSTDQPVAVVGLWSLLADSNRTPAPKGMTNNARAEGIDKLSTFKGPWLRGQRCLIPADSYAEPNYERHAELGKSVWWDISRSDGEPLALAGLYNEWIDPVSGQVHPSFTMATIRCNDHALLNRMHAPEKDGAGQVLPLSQQDKRAVVPIQREDWNQWLYGSVDDAWPLLKLPQPSWYSAQPRIP